MSRPECHSLRRLVAESEVFLCAHPQVHAMRNVVTPAVCKSCGRRTDPPPAEFRSVTFGTAPLRQRAGMQLVVARYRENLDWLRRFRGLSQIVYDKGDPGAENPLPNVGREAHTYLHHVLANYDRLAPITVFLQGDPHAHASDLDEKIWCLEQGFGYRDLVNHILVEDAGGQPVQPGLPVGEMYKELFDEPAPEFFLSHSAACFAVSKENILRRPREFYQRALKAVVRRPLGPWEIERLWQYIFRTRVAARGVVTAADAGFFRELRLFLLSYRRFAAYPLVVYDLGLHPEQRHWCLEQPDVSLLPSPTIYKPVERIRRQHWWQAWLKPFYIYNSPFDRVLWIDADCTLLGQLHEAFREMDERPLIVRDATSAVTENRPELYRHLPIRSGARTEGVNVNSGVLGFCKLRDKALLNAWGYGVAWAAMNQDKQSLSAWADQGMLLWALHRTGQTQFIRGDLAWNCPVHASRPGAGSAPSPSLLATAAANGHSVLEEIRRRYPDAKIVHWLGDFKLGPQLDRELEQLFLRGAGDW